MKRFVSIATSILGRQTSAKTVQVQLPPKGTQLLVTKVTRNNFVFKGILLTNLETIAFGEPRNDVFASTVY